MDDLTRIQAENDIERLRQIAVLQAREIALLHKRLQELTKELSELRGDPQVLQKEIETLLAQINTLQRRQFELGKSERRGRAKDAAADDEPNTSQTGHGPTEQSELLFEDVIHDLDEGDQICPTCGNALTLMEGQAEVSEEIDIVERYYVLKRHHRLKYRCQCNACIETALGPTKLIPGGRYSINFAISVVIDKYLNHMPLARQVTQMKRLGLKATSQALWDQCFALAELLTPNYGALAAYLRSEEKILGIDETSHRLMSNGRGKTHSLGKTKRIYAWALRGEAGVYYHFDRSHSSGVARKLIGDFSGYLVCDGYRVYQALSKERGQRSLADQAIIAFILCLCWAHARRNFVEASKDFDAADEMLDLIGELYQIDRETRRNPLHSEEDPSRAERSEPVLQEIRRWMNTQRVLGESKLGQAIKYLNDHWTGLTEFLNNPDVPLDNNETEQKMRVLVMGRHNFQGMRSERGMKAASVLYTLTQSCVKQNVDPAYVLA